MMYRQGLIPVDYRQLKIFNQILTEISNNSMAIIKVLMAENLKQVTD